MSPICNAFSIDVEDWFQVAALASAVPRQSWNSRESRVERNTDIILSLCEEAGVHGTFFVLGWIAERCPGLVRRIASAGHEIASHGWSHELVYRQNLDDFRNETVRSKQLLEDQASVAVRGYRAASFSITRQSLWALDVLLDAGFTYDSSVFPIRHDRYGMPNAMTSPHVLSAPSGRAIIEFPLSTARWLGQRVPVSGGGYFRLLPYWLIRAGLRQVNARQAAPFTFYLHPWEVDPGQPRMRVSALSRIRHYTNLSVCEHRLRRLLREFKFAPMRDVLSGLDLPAAASMSEAARGFSAPA